jgi:nitrate reductase gamma subunit
MSILLILTYIALIVFVLKILERAIRIASAPVHLRWELYPVPHEKGRAAYGGSILEEVDWWTKKAEKDHLGELKVMIPEIFFLKGVWDHNKTLWFGSFTFHFGLYLLIGNMFLAILALILGLQGIVVEPGRELIVAYAHYILFYLGLIGSIIGLAGSIRLFFQRIVESRLAVYSTPSHYFNLVLIGFLYFTLLMWQIFDPHFVSNLIGYYKSLFTFSAMPAIPAIGYWHIITALVLFGYLPFTHMTHFFTKYFTYHKVRWEDEPNMKGSKIPEKVSALLNQKVTWAAPHIGADGTKNWIAIASSMPGKEEK